MGGRAKQKTGNRKQRGPTRPRMPTDLVQEGCNGRNGHQPGIPVGIWATQIGLIDVRVKREVRKKGGGVNV